MISSEYCCSVFSQVIEKYHQSDDVNTVYPWEFDEQDIHQMLSKKSWIDTVQWHLEDIIRRSDLEPQDFIQTKRKIDASNQVRTDLVEKMDEWFMQQIQNVKLADQARLNTETLAWAIDRLSILMLKIFHMDEQTQRKDATSEHILLCNQKLAILLMQKTDLCFSINNLISELESGTAIMKLYRQMKMYNDPSTNPELYKPTK